MERLQRAHDYPWLPWTGGVSAKPPKAPEATVALTDRGGAPKQHGTARVRIDRSLFEDRPIVMPDDSGPAAHAYRMMRAQLLQRVRLNRARAIGIVSAANLEGKTLTAVNLALSLAVEPNQRVLLVDLDLRRPSVAGMLKLQVARGLESWLDGSVASVGEVVYRVDNFERLSILPTRNPVAGSSSDILASERAQGMLRELKTAVADRLVVFDLPPLLLTDDFLTIASHLDGVVVVAREGHTKREDLHRMREMLGTVAVLGTVLTYSKQFERRAY